MDKLLNEDETAAVLGIPVRTLAYYRQVKKGPVYHKVEGHVRYALQDLKAYLEKVRVVPAE
jgi:hypothetical protein